ncbi:MAG: hypothetical protein IJW78_00290 [Clostridia bacterium]|nr:hypothetical protein [Clostridia bacterium]
MKNTIWLKRTLAVVVSAIILLSSLSATIFAATTPANFVLSSAAYDETRKTYVNQSSFKSGDIAYMKITTTSISNLGALAFTLSFDTSAFTFIKNKSSCLIDTADSELQYHLNEGTGKLKVVYDAGKYNVSTTTSGTIFYVAFQVNKINANANYNFVLTIDDLYDNTTKMNDIPCNTTASVTITAAAEGIPATTLALFQKLETIVYPDSKEDIDAGLSAYNLLTSSQREYLKQNHPQEYEWVSTATYRYNRAAEQASQALLQQEIEEYKAAHARVLGLTTETVTLADKTDVNTAKLAADGLSSLAQAHLAGEIKLVNNLKARVDELAEIDEEVTTFLSSSNYQKVADRSILNDDLAFEYNLYDTELSVALLDYGILSEGAKEILKTEYEWLLELRAAIDKYIAKDEDAIALAAKVVEFVKTYQYAFDLNDANVEISDKGAIKMVLEAYEALTDEALKTELASYADNFDSLLELIDELEAEQGEIEIPDPEIITETVTETVTKTVTKIKTVTNSLKQIINSGTPLSNTILFLFLILSLDIIILIMVYILQHYYKKKQQAMAMVSSIPEEVY